MPNVTCSQAVQADLQSIWRIFLDKIEHPERYMAYVKGVRILEDTDDHVIREISTDDMTLTEKITLDERMGEVRFTLVDHPLFEGYVLHQLIPPAADLANGLPVVTITMNWTPKNEEGQAVERMAGNDIKQSMEEAALYIKRMAEQYQQQQHVTG